MGRPATPPKTALGVAIRARRADASGETLADGLGIHANSLYRLERGEHEPSFNTALRLARWLGPDWTVERVMEAARAPA